MNADQVRFGAALLKARQLLLQSGAPVDAVKDAFMRAFAFAPDRVEAHPVLADYLNRNGRADEGAALLQPLFEADRLGAEGAMALGNCQASLGRFAQAREAYQRAVTLQPENALAHNNLGYVLGELGAHDEALSQLSEAVILQPGFMLPQANLVELLTRQNRWADALMFCKNCHQADPSARSHYLLGRAHLETGELAQARAVWTEGLARFPGDGVMTTHLGGLCYRNGEIERATELFAARMRANPQDTVATSNYLLALNYLPHPPEFIHAEHVAHTRAWPGADTPGPAKKPRLPAECRDRPVRVAYVGPDFYQHPVGQIIAPVILAHDPARIEAHAYHAGTQSDDLTAALRGGLGARWHDAGHLSNDALAAQIRADGIDILVDLSGHTGDNRLPLFVNRVAPVQVTYLGYPNTTGLANMDYRVTDAIADPPGLADRIHSETLLRMPAPFLCLRKPDELPDCGPTPMAAQGHITLASFNNLAKLSSGTLALWSRVMAAVPDARLIVKAAPLADEVLRQEQLRRFEAAGIDTARVEMQGRMGFRQHLALYQRVDLALDPFPYHGTATTIEALWMGIPVLALAGQTHVSRVSVSLLTALGLPELIADSEDAYVARCRHFASHPGQLQALRAGMRARLEAHPATQPADSARKLEALYLSLR